MDMDPRDGKALPHDGRTTLNTPHTPADETSHRPIVVRDMTAGDAAVISAAFTAIGWDKPESQYHRYFDEMDRGGRDVLVAEVDGRFAGYATVVWRSDYAPFREAGIPEIVDLNVLPEFRRRGVASAILDEAEARIAWRSPVAGIGVGMYPDYGAAQRLYVRRGYVPDGRGLCYDREPLPPMAATTNDDSLNLYLTRTLGACSGVTEISPA